MLHKAWYSLELRVTISPRVLPLGFMGIIHQFLWCVGAQGLIWGCLSALPRPRHSVQTSPPWHLPLPPSTLPGQVGAMPAALIFPVSTCRFPLSTPLPGGGWRLGPPLRDPHCPPPPSTGLLLSPASDWTFYQSLCLLNAHPYQSWAHDRTQDFETEKNQCLCFLPLCCVIPSL